MVVIIIRVVVLPAPLESEQTKDFALLALGRSHHRLQEIRRACGRKTIFSLPARLSSSVFTVLCCLWSLPSLQLDLQILPVFATPSELGFARQNKGL